MQKPSNHVAGVPTQAEALATKIEEFGFKNFRSLFTNTTASFSPNGMLSIVVDKKKNTGNRRRTVDGPLTHAEHFTKSIHKTDLRMYNYK